jgi:hypothetical protein
MHRASASILSFICSELWLCSDPGPGANGEHLRCAERNAGDRGSIEPGFSWTPPPGPGSGKFGTPFERMQFANLRPPGTPPDPDELPEEPHAAIASAQPASASGRTRCMRTVVRAEA